MNATQMYAMSLDQCSNVISVGGHLRTVLVQGDMGTGKSSLLAMLAKEHPKHIACYFDCTTKDLGDVTIPDLVHMEDGSGFVRYLTNEELGAHNQQPIILMVDEFGKSNAAVKLALLRLMLERKIGSYTLHPDSLVFATTNKGSEGVGDLLPPHARNRITLVTTRKPSAEETIEYGVNNGWNPSVLGFVREFPHILQSFEDVKNPEDNPYIYHPSAPSSRQFVTNRSLHATSDWLNLRLELDDVSVMAVLIGTIGERGAMDLMAFVKLADQLPSWESIKQDPLNAKVPDSASAICMVVYSALARMSKDAVTPWMDYLPRLSREAQGMFANGVRASKYTHRSLVMSNGKFTKWAMENNYMFAADK